MARQRPAADVRLPPVESRPVRYPDPAIQIVDPSFAKYRVNNSAGAEPWTGPVSFEGPPPCSSPQQESWTLFCEQPEGVIRSARQVYVARGEKRTLDLRTDCKVRR